MLHVSMLFLKLLRNRGTIFPGFRSRSIRCVAFTLQRITQTCYVVQGPVYRAGVFTRWFSHGGKSRLRVQWWNVALVSLTNISTSAAMANSQTTYLFLLHLRTVIGQRASHKTNNKRISIKCKSVKNQASGHNNKKLKTWQGINKST